MPSRHVILHFGYDPLLTDARIAVLEDAGYEVITADTSAAAMRVLRTRRVHLIVACHSVPPEELQFTVRHMRLLRPKVPILVVHVGGLVDPQRALADACVDGLRGPEHLLSQVASSLIRATRAAAS